MKKRSLSLIVFMYLLSACSANPYAILSDCDDQYYWHTNWNCPLLTESEDGYYYYSMPNNILYYLDGNSIDAFAVCSQPNCLHNGEDCQAFFPYYNLETGVMYAGEYLYVFARSMENTTPSLYRVSKDGTSRETLLTLEGGASYTDPLLHRGTFYILKNSYDEAQHGLSVLLAYPLDALSKGGQVLYSAKTEETLSGITQVMAYGDAIYLTDYSTTSASPVITIHRTDIKTGALSSLPLPEGMSVSRFMPQGGSIFYTLRDAQNLYDTVTEVQLYRCDPDFGGSCRLSNISAMDLSCDDTYLYGLCDEALTVYDQTGALYRTFPMSEIFGETPRYANLYCSCREQLFFWAMLSCEEHPTLYRFDRTEIETGSIHPKPVLADE
ncbi:MAG: hypothetical protein VB111_12955 [Clostridiaceae bacterium]|nr:hypothetical protein [Clostridiaceae bacterium]